MSTPAFRVVIPARFGASRLPGKPLRDVAGTPLIVRCMHNAERAGALSVTVATDDERIAEVVARSGGHAVMTSADHKTGTDRLAEVSRREAWPDDTIVVNLQGDEPLIDGALLRQLAEALATHPEAGIATMATPIHDSTDLFSPHVVKVVLRDDGHAMYFSRAPIPWVRDLFSDGVPDELPTTPTFLRHLGLYAYRAGTLAEIVRLPRHPIESAESLEQLRPLATGTPIHVSVLPEAPPHGIDTEADLRRVVALLKSAEAHD